MRHQVPTSTSQRQNKETESMAEGPLRFSPSGLRNIKVLFHISAAALWPQLSGTVISSVKNSTTIFTESETGVHRLKEFPRSSFGPVFTVRGPTPVNKVTKPKQYDLDINRQQSIK